MYKELFLFLQIEAEHKADVVKTQNQEQQDLLDEVLLTEDNIILNATMSRGISEAVAKVMLAARRQSSDRQYKVYFSKYLQFCRDKTINPLRASLAEGLSFLDSLHSDGLSYSAINSARSALSLVLRFEGINFGSHPDVIQYMKGIGNLKPSAPRYSQVWDLDIVLKTLKLWAPKQKLDLRVLTMKTVMLVLIVSGQRPQIISKLNIDRMEISPNKVTFSMLQSDFKQGNRGTYPEKLEFSKFPGDKRVCVHTYLIEYMQRTLDIRKANKSLFLTVGTPHHAPTVSTITRWIKSVFRHAGISTDKYSPASVRTAVASKAVDKGVSICDILKLGGWTRESTFTKFYKKPIVKQDGQSIQSILLS